MPERHYRPICRKRLVPDKSSVTMENVPDEKFFITFLFPSDLSVRTLPRFHYDNADTLMKFPGVQYPRTGHDHSSGAEVRVLIQSLEATEDAVVFITMKNIDYALNDETAVPEDQLVATRIVSVGLAGGQTDRPLSPPMNVVFEHKPSYRNNVSHPQCLAWIDGEWSSKGCSVVDTNGTHTSCACDRLTRFALVNRVTDQLQVRTSNPLGECGLVNHNLPLR